MSCTTSNSGSLPIERGPQRAARPAVPSLRARGQLQPPFRELRVARFDLADLEVLGHGQQPVRTLNDVGVQTGCVLTTAVWQAPPTFVAVQPSRGSSTNTGIWRSVFSWYSAYGG